MIKEQGNSLPLRERCVETGRCWASFVVRSLLTLVCLLATCGPVLAQDNVTVAIRAECSGQPRSQVAVRWGHPDYSTATGQYLKPIFTAHCGTGVQTASTSLQFRKSEFEIQTEGGIETSYAVEVTLTQGGEVIGSANVRHAGSPDLIVRGSGFTVTRTSGPNRYGEQNFRVRLQGAPKATAKLVASSSGSGAQMAVRWGHADFHENEYFSTWIVPATAGESTKTFPLTNDNSEFEIQTEGGEGAGYHLSLWFDLGNGMDMQPSVDITHHLNGTQLTTGGSGATFARSSGNAFGEMNVRVTVPSLPVEAPPMSTPIAMAPGFSAAAFWNCRSAPVSLWESIGGRAFVKVATLAAAPVGGCGATYPVGYTTDLKDGLITSFIATMPSSSGCNQDDYTNLACIVDSGPNLLGRSKGPVFSTNL